MSFSRENNLIWKKIRDVKLDVVYVKKFFQKEIADELFRTFERDFEYFTDELAMVKVFGKWHKIPRKQVF